MLDIAAPKYLSYNNYYNTFNSRVVPSHFFLMRLLFLLSQAFLFFCFIGLSLTCLLCSSFFCAGRCVAGDCSLGAASVSLLDFGFCSISGKL
jgi:hypothetical protein